MCVSSKKLTNWKPKPQNKTKKINNRTIQTIIGRRTRPIKIRDVDRPRPPTHKCHHRCRPSPSLLPTPIAAAAHRRRRTPVRMNPILSFELLFFAVFGQTTTDQTQIDKMTANTPRTQPYWTEYLFKIVFGIYMLVSVVVLINLLIAMMSDTYQRIQVSYDENRRNIVPLFPKSILHSTKSELCTNWIDSPCT